MPALDVEDFYESDFSDNDEDHSRLLSSVSQLDSTQRVKPAQRKEIASEVSEYNLSRGAKKARDLINVRELAKVLGRKAEHGVITKKFNNVINKSKTLPKPLEKPTEERLKRSLGFEKVKKQLRRWDAIVTRNAISDRICFPLSDNSMKMQKSTEFLSQFKNKTPLEEEIAKVLKEDDKKTAEEEEEEKAENEFPLTLEEMLEKRKEMAQLRAKLSYRQTKAQRQSKIKSKKYHRFLKREKIKQQLKEFEILQKTDPEAALKKLSELDKTRAQERASLRHRNTGKWARNLTVRAKYDVETRKVLAEQLKVSRDLTQKVSQEDSSDSNEEGEEEPLKKDFLVQPPPTAPSSENPWTLEVSKDVQEFMSGYRKFWSEQNKDAAQKKSGRENIDEDGRSEKVSRPDEKIPENGEENQRGDSGAKSLPKAKEDKLSPKSGEENEKGDAEAKPPLKAKISPESGEENEKGDAEAKPPLKAKISPKRMRTSVSIYPASGVWIVTPVAEVPESRKPKPKKDQDIDSLFDELNEKLLKEAAKKAERIKRKLSVGNEKGKKKKKKEKAPEFDLSLKDPNAVQRPDMDVGLLEGGVEDDLGGGREPSSNGHLNGETVKSTPAIDPEKFIQVKPKRLRTCLPDGGEGDEDALDDEKAHQVLMEEAFEDDNVAAEFNAMRRAEEQKKKVEVQTSLPGWGDWAGSGIVPKVKRKRLLVLKVPARKQQKKDLIVNENENPNLRSHLVKEVPHPFTSVEAFEANIRAPIGRDWIPETAHQKLIQKPVVTKLGTVIEPMNENEIVRLKKAPRCPYQGKKTKNNNK